MSGAKIHARLLAAVENYNVKEMKKKQEKLFCKLAL
jgi:hypothetical protein